MKTPHERVECSAHGAGEAAYVCQHLVSGVGLGFHAGYDDDRPDQLWPGAWCDACERVLDAEGEWNARSEAALGVRLVCDGCYLTLRERNWKQDGQDA